NPAAQDIVLQAGGATFEDGFVAMLLLLHAMLAAAVVIQGTLQLRGEESAGRAEPLLATALPRWRWAASGLTVAMIGGAVTLVLSAFAMGVTAAAVTGVASWATRVPMASLAYLPTVWLMGGVALALVGRAPGWPAVAWLVLVYAVAVWLLGALVGLPQWLMDLSPFRHAPQAPAEDVTMFPVVILLGITVALLAVGFAGLRRRDIAVV